MRKMLEKWISIQVDVNEINNVAWNVHLVFFASIKSRVNTEMSWEQYSFFVLSIRKSELIEISGNFDFHAHFTHEINQTRWLK